MLHAHLRTTGFTMMRVLLQIALLLFLVSSLVAFGRWMYARAAGGADSRNDGAPGLGWIVAWVIVGGAICVAIFLAVFGANPAFAQSAQGSKPASSDSGTSCDYGQPDPSASAETAQFAFLIGDFDITLHAWQGDSWSPSRPAHARWNGRWGMDGIAIVDEWFDPYPQTDGAAQRGINVRLFDPQEKLWKMMWISTRDHVVQDLRARMQDGRLVMWQVSPPRPDFRAEFEVDDPDHWARVSWRVDPGTGEAVREYRLAATRIPCSA